MKIIWVIGSTKSLGTSIAKSYLDQGFRVIGFSKSLSPVKHDLYRHHVINFENTTSLKSLFLNVLRSDPPNDVIFSQRFRADMGNEEQKINNGISVEVIAPLILFRLLNEEGGSRKTQFIFLSSSAGKGIHIDLDFCYHLLKRSTILLSKYISTQKSLVRSNCIILGEFLKYPIDQYNLKEKEKFLKIEKYSSGKKNVTATDVVSTVNFLTSSNFNGQEIYLDGGISFISGESIIRNFSKL